MATDKEKLATVAAIDNTNNNPPAEENPKKDVDPTDREQNFAVAIYSTAADSKKDSEVLKTTVSTVSSLSANDGLVSDVQKKMRRAERFGMSVQLSEEEKRNSRAERFGTLSKAHGLEVSKTSEELKKKARAERFGLAVPSSAGDEEAKRKARLARFAPYPKPDAIEEDKRKARAIRFSETPASSLSQLNGKGNIEPKAPITGKAGGGT